MPKSVAVFWDDPPSFTLCDDPAIATDTCQTSDPLEALSGVRKRLVSDAP